MRLRYLLITLPIIVILAACGNTAGTSASTTAPDSEPAVVADTYESDGAEPVSESESESETIVETEAKSEADAEASDNGLRVVTDADTEVFYSADDPSVLGKLNTYCTEGGLGEKTVTVTGRLEYLLPDTDGGVLVFWDSEDTVFCPAPTAAKRAFDQYGELQNCICTIKITFSDTPISYTYIDGSYQQVDGLSYVTDVEIIAYKQL